MKRKASLIKRTIAALLGLALVLPSSLSFVGVGGTAEAATSLPHIQEIRNSGGVFEIMELVPAPGQGSIGYYVDGQEPCSDWKTKAAKMNVADRAAYVNTLFSALAAANILGAGDSTPLRGTPVDGGNYYKEYYPWTKPAAVTNIINLINATNDARTETQTVKGTATDGGAHSGEYLSSGYILQTSKSGRYNQNITGFAQDEAANSYYYAVTFSPLTLGQAVPTGTYLYYEAQTGDTPSLTAVPISGGGTKNLVFQEIKGEYTVLDSEKTYFSASFDQPHAAYNASTAPFRAISDDFTDVGNSNGWFKADVSKLKYVGGNEGNISFVANTAGADTCEITYDCVFYQGGYTNNNWFIRHVFDWEQGEEKPSVIVSSYTPSDFDGHSNNLKLVGMVVISAGFNPSGAVTPYAAANDISAATVTALYNAIYDDPAIADDDCKLPIVFDSQSAVAAAVNLSGLYNQLKTLTGLTATPALKDSVYLFGTTQFADNSSTDKLITPAFNRHLPENTYKPSGSLYLPVYKEISDENFTRQNTGSGVALLEEKVTMARNMRYIINFAKQRNVAPKGDIRVLEVQPANGSYFATEAGKTALQSWTGVALANTTIDTMTAAEFIGKIDDLAETYDLIYFGNEISGFNSTSGGLPTYSNYTMNGLLYSNIGDLVVSGGDSGWNMSGLLDRDYDPSRTFNNEDGGGTYYSIDTGDPSSTVLGVSWRFYEKDIARTYRYSGNDITPAKMQELSEYVRSGYPVVVADNLMDPGRGIQYYNVQLNFAADHATNKVTLTPVVTGTYQNYTVKSCKWYRDGTLYKTVTTSTILAPEIITADSTQHKYYCVVDVAEGASSGSPATSNTVVVKTGISAQTIANSNERPGVYIKEKYNFNVNSTTVPNGIDNWSTNPVTLSAVAKYSDGTEVVAGSRGVSSISYEWYYYDSGDYASSSKSFSTYNTGKYQCVVTVTTTNGNTYWALSDIHSVRRQLYWAKYYYWGVIQSGGDVNNSGTYNLLDNFNITLKDAVETQVNGSAGYTFEVENPLGVPVNYTWYKNNVAISNLRSFSDAAPAGVTDYYCAASPSDQSDPLVKSAITKIIRVTNQIAANSTDLTSVTGAYVKITPPNQNTVDNCSNMYSFLDTIKDKTNLMTASNAETNKELLRRHMNLSKPKIQFVDFGTALGKPKTYTETDPDSIKLGRVTKTGADGVQYNVYQLEYRFRITNSTDATPGDTRYYCNLFVDTNADGRYRDSELLTGLKIYEQFNGTPVPSKPVSSGKLKAGVVYYAECELPSDMAGIVPWQLEVTKVSTGTGATATDNSHIHTSYHSYAYIRPDAPQVIDILQVNTSRTSQSWFGLVTTNYNGINLQEQLQTVSSSAYYSSVTGKYYKGIYGKLFADVSRDFKVNITTIKANQLDGMRARQIPDANGVMQTVTYNSLKEYLDSYNMLVLGFDDCYQELSAASAAEVVGYIDTGKAVLFTHDTTSFFFLPSRTYQTDRSFWNSLVSASPYMKYVYGKPGLLNSLSDFINNRYTSFGYNFNMRLRDAVGLDRYGVTNKTYGISVYAPTTFRGANWNGIVARGNLLSDQQKLDLTSLGYSVAYNPKSGTKNAAGEIVNKGTVPDTQGLTSWLLQRYYVSGGKATKDGKTGSFGDYTTSQVSQVNEGQITTYPFNVNTKGFGGTESTLQIAPTHFQYQQLNMNNDDVVVWYTLSGGEFDKSPRDVTNSYYIYSRGNVTYSGAGHTTDAASVNANVSEAKLFVNTMIASFRVAQTKPSVRFTDTQGSATVSSAVIPADGSTSLVTKVSGAVTDSSRIVCFTIKDSNIGSKTITAKFGVGKNADGTPIAPTTALDVYEKRAAGGDIKNTAGLVPGVVYYVKLDDIIKAFGSSLGDAPVELNMQISCKLKGAVQDKTLLSDIVPLKLYRIRLFDLG